MTKFPLAWPAGWRRTPLSKRKDGRFSKKTTAYRKDWQDANKTVSYSVTGHVTVSEGTKRVLEQLRSFGVQDGDAIISTNLTVRLDGLPRSDQREPENPGVAVYWQRTGDAQHKVMAIDCYTRVADNLAAIAATLEAMRAIERHGGAMILERAFAGFQCLPAPNTWRSILGFTEDAGPSLDQVRREYRMQSMGSHPDQVGGSEAKQQELNWAMEQAERELTP